MKSRIIEAIKNNEKIMKRINKAIAGEREMKGGYLSVTATMINDLGIISWEEHQKQNIWELYEECIQDILKSKEVIL